MAANRFNEQDHPRDETGKFIDKGAGESSNAQALIKDIPDTGTSEPIKESSDARKLINDVKESGGVSGGISGALSNDDPRAEEHAKRFYEAMRHRKDDIVKIANNTGYKKEQIVAIKNYLFYDKHNLTKGYNRFDEDFWITQSWQRLMEGKNILECDLMLLKHEQEEMKIKKENPNLTHDEAHELAEKKYNYTKAYTEAIKNGQIKEDKIKK